MNMVQDCTEPRPLGEEMLTTLPQEAIDFKQKDYCLCPLHTQFMALGQLLLETAFDTFCSQDGLPEVWYCGLI